MLCLKIRRASRGIMRHSPVTFKKDDGHDRHLFIFTDSSAFPAPPL